MGIATGSEAGGEGTPAGSRPVTAHQVLGAEMDRQASVLAEQITAAAGGQADPVHDARIATRRLRAVLGVYRALFAAEERVDVVGRDLRWLGSTLGHLRDVHVLRARVASLTAHAGTRAPVAARIDAALAQRQDEATRIVAGALEDPRVGRLLTGLTTLSGPGPWAAAAAGPAVEVLPGLLAAQVRALDDAMERARSGPTDVRDEALHSARKKVRRVRYAADAVGAALGEPAAVLAKWAHEVQDALGEQHDSVVAGAFLHGPAAASGDPDDAVELARLSGLEEARAHRAVEEYERLGRPAQAHAGALRTPRGPSAAGAPGARRADEAPMRGG